MRQSISKKNGEIVKLIESIGEAENEDIAELGENLELLREENGVLKEPLGRLKEEVGEREREEERLGSALRQVEEEFRGLEGQKN